MEIKAKIIAYSKRADTGKEIVTFELEYPRFIHSEVMTHRVFSRNAMSSRAIPIEKMMEQVENDPAHPVQWGLNQSGMQAGKEHKDPSICKSEWKLCAQRAVGSAELLQRLGLHKQIVNRVLEPFQMMCTVVTATEWDNFFELRCHRDAQPEFQVLAHLMREELDNSFPRSLQEGEWHLPYVKWYHHFGSGEQIFFEGDYEKAYVGEADLFEFSIEDAIKISASCCAQVSYRKNDTSLDKAIHIYDRLIESKPVHASPFEHQARVGDDSTKFGNFKWWEQYRQMLEI